MNLYYYCFKNGLNQHLISIFSVAHVFFILVYLPFLFYITNDFHRFILFFSHMCYNWNLLCSCPFLVIYGLYLVSWVFSIILDYVMIPTISYFNFKVIPILRFLISIYFICSIACCFLCKIRIARVIQLAYVLLLKLDVRFLFIYL